MTSAANLEVEPGPSELSVEDALEVAVRMHRLGHVEQAEIVYRRILDVAPEQPDALNFLGMVLMHRGLVDEAIELVRKSISIDPQRGDLYNNLGNVLLVAERIDEAIAAYEQAIARAPSHAAAYNNLGVIYRAQGRLDDAAKVYDRALELNPEHVETHTNYGNLLAGRGDLEAALAHYKKALDLRPHDGLAKKYIALVYVTMGDFPAAEAVYRKWIENDPDDPSPRHLLAALTGVDVPARASEQYIEDTFDEFATSFDAKLAKLEYRAPQLVADAVEKAGMAPTKRLDVLDAGCGTGLCGPLLAPYAQRIEGVDLSARMLEKARARGVYDDLVKGELTQFLQSRNAAYDLVASADTLVYFGVLADVANAAWRALRAGGLLVFTVEKADEADAPAGHRIHPHGRYSHTRTYVEETLRSAGFPEVSFENAVLRHESKKPVDGLVVTARKGLSDTQDAATDDI